MTRKFTAFTTVAAVLLISSSAFAFSPQRQKSEDAMDRCDIGAREASCDETMMKGEVKDLVPFTGEPDPFASEPESVQHQDRYDVGSDEG